MNFRIASHNLQSTVVVAVVALRAHDRFPIELRTSLITRHWMLREGSDKHQSVIEFFQLTCLAGTAALFAHSL
jgi:hypothetical protein